jgi:hypothetical protein
MLVQDLIDKYSALVGDTLQTDPTDFVITGLNKAFNELPSYPKLDKLFEKHYQVQLAGNNEWRWNLNQDGDYRKISNIPTLTFWDNSKAGDPCKLAICNLPNGKFYERNGIIKLKTPGRPCEYTIETEDDSTYLVFDRPLDKPLFIDYVIYGYPKNVQSPDEQIALSAIAENLILEYLKYVHYQESDDFAFAGSVFDTLDNKLVPEALQQLYKPMDSDAPIIIGG